MLTAEMFCRNTSVAPCRDRKKDLDGRDKPGHDEHMGHLIWKTLQRPYAFTSFDGSAPTLASPALAARARLKS